MPSSFVFVAVSEYKKEQTCCGLIALDRQVGVLLNTSESNKKCMNANSYAAEHISLLSIDVI